MDRNSLLDLKVASEISAYTRCSAGGDEAVLVWTYFEGGNEHGSINIRYVPEEMKILVFSFGTQGQAKAGLITIRFLQGIAAQYGLGIEVQNHNNQPNMKVA